MRAYDLIYKKREGERLNKEEINYLIKGYTNGTLPDYQLSAWAMAVFFQGMDASETADLTTAMVKSGEQIDLGKIKGVKVDKHSTGGVGDKTTLVLVPLVSAAGIPVAKMSGRGLGHTGGTVDKLESIPGFNTDLTIDQFINAVNNTGAAVVGQTGNLTPADKKLYALRDVTATVDSIPLIASSIMSKKIAGGADGIVLDVKTGDGAFMKELSEAKKLARTMVEIGKRLDRKTTAVISDMNQPLGMAIGNALEVKEAIWTLKGQGPADLKELSLTLGSYMLIIAGRVDNFKDGYDLLKNILESGEALKQLKKIIGTQGGKVEIADNLNLLPEAQYQISVESDREGFINSLKSRELGLVAMSIGAGRKTKEDKIDPSVGIVLKKKRGDYIGKGECVAVLHLNDLEQKKEAFSRLKDCFLITDNQPEEKKLIYEIIK